METTNFFSSVAALKITGAENNWIVSVISQRRRIGIPFPVGGKPLHGVAVQPLTQSRFPSISFPVIRFVQQAAALIIMLLL